MTVLKHEKTVEENPAPIVRFNLYFSDPTDGENGGIRGPYQQLKDAEKVVAKLTADGFVTQVDKQTPQSFVADQTNVFMCALWQVRIEANVREFHAAGWPDQTTATFIDQARNIGESYGRTIGFLATDWDEWTGFDNHTLRFFEMTGVDKCVVKLAKVFAEKAFWRARKMVFETMGSD